MESHQIEKEKFYSYLFELISIGELRKVIELLREYPPDDEIAGIMTHQKGRLASIGEQYSWDSKQLIQNQVRAAIIEELDEIKNEDTRLKISVSANLGGEINTVTEIGGFEKIRETNQKDKLILRKWFTLSVGIWVAVFGIILLSIRRSESIPVTFLNLSLIALAIWLIANQLLSKSIKGKFLAKTIFFIIFYSLIGLTICFGKGEVVYKVLVVFSTLFFIIAHTLGVFVSQRPSLLSVAYVLDALVVLKTLAYGLFVPRLVELLAVLESRYLNWVLGLGVVFMGISFIWNLIHFVELRFSNKQTYQGLPDGFLLLHPIPRLILKQIEKSDGPSNRELAYLLFLLNSFPQLKEPKQLC